MTALDANTALRPYREAQYDLRELLSGLSVLVGEDPAVHLLRYADGSTAPVAPAALMRALVTSFPCMTFASTVGLYLTGDGLKAASALPQAVQLRKQLAIVQQVPLLRGMSVWRAVRNALALLDSSVGLMAKVNGSTMEHVGEGPVPVRNSAIRHLTVARTASTGDASDALEGNSVEALQAGTVSVTGVLDAGDVRTENYNAQALKGQHIGTAEAGSIYFPSSGIASYQPVYVSRPNAIGASAGGSANAPAMFGKLGLEQRPAEEIVLEGGTIHIAVPSLGARTTGHANFAYSIPYTEDGTVLYLPVAKTGSNMQEDKQQLPAPDGMGAMLLWPMWGLVTETLAAGSSVTYETTYQALARPFDGYPVIRVTNHTGSPIAKLAHAWQFGKQGDGRGAVSVLSTVDLPPYSSVTFLFEYDGVKNTAYMYPTRDLHNG